MEISGCIQMKQAEVFDNVSDDENDENESGSEEESDDEAGDDEYTDMAGLLASLLATEDDNVCTAMLKISTQLETTNRLLAKLIVHVTKKE
jgi:hypothetical protein